MWKYWNYPYICRILGCGGVTISNGQVTFTDGNTQYNAVASVTCNDGYSLGGSGVITCLDSGVWDISQAACSIKGNAAFTLTTIRPRLVSWSLSWTNLDYRIQSYQIASHLDINRDNRAYRGKIFGCQKFCHDYHDWRDYRDRRIRSYDIVTNRNKSYLILFLNRGDRDRPKHRDLLR